MQPPTPSEPETSPVMAELADQQTASVVAVAGHPLHAASVHFPIALAVLTLGADLVLWWDGDPFWQRAGLWAAGLGFVTGALAGLIGLAELLLVAGIRLRVTGWAHGVAAVMLIAGLGANWGLRMHDPDAVLPHGLLLSGLVLLLTGIAGWHGGKLVFHHGIGLKEPQED